MSPQDHSERDAGSSPKAPLSRRWIRKQDLWVFLGAAGICLVFFIFLWKNDAGDAAQIYLSDTLVQTVSLSEDQVFSPPGCENVVLEVKDGRIRFQSSDCPDQICVQTGWISHTGEYALCLPNRVLVRIPSSGDFPDAVTH